MRNTIENIVEHVLIQNRIRNYDKKDLELQLQIHPNYPSFQSITDTLDYFDIDSIAVEVPIEALDQLPKSFITLVQTEDANEITSVIKKDNRITLKHSNVDKKNYTLDEFKKIWVPKVIAVEHNTYSNLFDRQSIFQNLLLGILLICIIFLSIINITTVSQLSFLILSIIGIICSVFAVRESLGIQSQTMHQFCTTIGNSNCGDVINSNTGTLIKGVTLADAGIIFFGIITLHQLFFGYTSILLLPTVISIPFILYSLYTQAFVIKKWCAICIAISSISSGLIIIAVLSLPIEFTITTTASFILLSSLATLGYMYSKQYLTDSTEYKNQHIKLNHFKRDRQIFEYLLSISDTINDTSPIANEIILGNKNASFKITSITNPMCGYCKGAFEAYTRVLRTMKDELQIVIRLKVSLDDMNNPATQISLRLLDIYHEQGSDAFIQAYNGWFENRTFASWIKKYGNPTNHVSRIEALNKQSKWAENNNLLYTPASIINQTIYPKKYNYDEFFHFTSILVENQQETVFTTAQKPAHIS